MPGIKTDQPKVSACLISWKRPENLGKIIASLHQWDFIDEILIHVNKPGANDMNYGRYLMAEKAKNSLIYTQDDDHIIKNVDSIYEMFLEQPTKISNGGIEDYLKVVPDNIYGSSQMAMVGWGTIFRKDWYQKPLQKYINKYGKDYCFYRETDRIFTMLMNQYHNMVLVDAEVLPGARGEEALSSQDDHIKYKQLAISRCKEILGI